MRKKPIRPRSGEVSRSHQNDVDNFIQQVDATTPAIRSGGRGRLIFAMDATASRQHSWDQATRLQHDMFTKTRGIGALDIQLVYFRGMGESRASSWISQPHQLTKLMQKVSCIAGQTQIEKVLRHGVGESKGRAVQAMVYIGDSMEENIDVLVGLAGQLKMLGLPVFIFQEGHDPVASTAFAQIAALSGGAHCRFDHSAARELGKLLNAVAIYAAGGKKALQRLGETSKSAAKLLEQL